MLLDHNVNRMQVLHDIASDNKHHHIVPYTVCHVTDYNFITLWIPQCSINAVIINPLKFLLSNIDFIFFVKIIADITDDSSAAGNKQKCQRC